MTRISILAAILLAGASAASAGGLSGLDRNGDGGVSQAEFLAVYGPERGVETFNYADRDNNGVIDSAEFRAQTSNGGIFSNI